MDLLKVTVYGSKRSDQGSFLRRALSFLSLVATGGNELLTVDDKSMHDAIIYKHLDNVRTT